MKKTSSGKSLPSSPTKSESNYNDMLDIKVNRKRAESDLQLLANRIALLRLEEQKAMNKVNETKTRAEEILEYVLRPFFFPCCNVLSEIREETKKFFNLKFS